MQKSFDQLQGHHLDLRSPMRILLLICWIFPCFAELKVELGVDLFVQKEAPLKGKRVGLVINQTSLDSKLRPTYELFKSQGINVVAIFCPEHGVQGIAYAGENVSDQQLEAVPVYSLHGTHRRPTAEMLKNIDTLVFDIQEIGCRSYTFASTLFYVMEEAAKKNIEVVVLDRPNPMNGLLVDGPMLQEKFRSFVGYVNVPYCHGLTIGELALLFNREYEIGCQLQVVPMRGWQRWMTFQETGLSWIPTSPNIPEPDTPFFYATTGILGELGLVNIGIGFTQPFKIVGAPWIEASRFAEVLNSQKIPGVRFLPYYFRPFYGLHEGKECQGVKILITNPRVYRPLTVQYLLIGVLKSLYPDKMEFHLAAMSKSKKAFFCQINGNDEMLEWLSKEKYVAWKMVQYDEEARQAFLKKRKEYLIY
jgi:uncharacterized protein YbbC (DUF1343 family)